MLADKIIYGNIYTVDKAQPRAEAAAIADGKFVYVGDEAGAKAYVGEGTEVERFEGGIILPGFGEGHGHVNPGGTEELFMVNLAPIGLEGTLEDIRALIAKHIEAHPDWDVYLGTGFIPIAEFGPEGPTAAMLEGLTTKPLVIADLGHHSYWVNAAAMDALHIDRDTPAPADGIIVRDADGNPAGYFREGAMDLISR